MNRERSRFLLIGDSHAGPIGKAARARGIPFHGGPLGAGRDFNTDFFDAADGDLTFRKKEANTLFRRFLGELGVSRFSEIPVPLVSTIGSSAHFPATRENWEIYADRSGTPDGTFLASPLFDAIIRAMTRDAIAFHEYALSLKLRVFTVMPPQRVPALSDRAVFMAAQETVRRALEALGVEIIDVRSRVTDASGLQRPEYCEIDDPLHGNLAFGQMILDDLIARGV
jgi:hypothetical protein